MHKLPVRINTVTTILAAALLGMSILAGIWQNSLSDRNAVRGTAEDSTRRSAKNSTEVAPEFVWPEEGRIDPDMSAAAPADQGPDRQPTGEETPGSEDGDEEDMLEPIESGEETGSADLIDNFREAGYKAVKIVDGDTIDVESGGKIERVRLIGVNTPESVDPRRKVECFGKEASRFVSEFIGGHFVRLEADPTQDDRDKFGRLLRYVYRDDGDFLNERIVADGFGYEYTYKVPYKFQAQFKAAQAQAKVKNMGLWSPDTCGGKK